MPVAAEQECRPPQLRRRGLREFSELLVRCHLTSAPQSCPARRWHVRASMPACRHTTDAPGAALGCVAPPKKVSLDRGTKRAGSCPAHRPRAIGQSRSAEYALRQALEIAGVVGQTGTGPPWLCTMAAPANANRGTDAA